MTRGPASVAILGTGELARAHARVAVAHPDLRLVAIVDPDAASGSALIERIVRRFEGERAELYPDLDAVLAAIDVDIVAVGDVDDTTVAGAAVAAGRTVIGGEPVAGSSGPGQWFPFDDARSAAGSPNADAAFTEHLRQYETVLSSIGRGPDRAGAGT